MKLSFKFTKKQVLEIAIFAIVVTVLLIVMAASGADFR